MPRTMLNDQHWSKLQNIFRQFNIYLKSNLRNFVEASLFRIRTGCPWRDLPSEFGNSNSIFQKFNRWSSNDKLMKIFKLFANDADVEWVFIDGSHVRAHQHSSGKKIKIFQKVLVEIVQKSTWLLILMVTLLSSLFLMGQLMI